MIQYSFFAIDIIFNDIVSLKNGKEIDKNSIKKENKKQIEFLELKILNLSIQTLMTMFSII